MEIILVIVTIGLVAGTIIGCAKNNPILTLICVRLLLIDAIVWSIWFAFFVSNSNLPFWFKYWLLK